MASLTTDSESNKSLDYLKMIGGTGVEGVGASRVDGIMGLREWG
jgi:hypothetical protein